MRLLVATRNAGKLREIRDLLAPEGVEVVGLAQMGEVPEVVEDGDTFLANARKKAWTLARVVGLPVLADDSGLSVDALGGRPGVLSARFAGPDASDGDNNRRLLEELEPVAEGERGAQFVCSMVLAVPSAGGEEFSAEGTLRGRILRQGRGDGGFGYDPLFWVDEAGATLAQLDLAAKNRLSHRSRALAALVPVLRRVSRRTDPG